MLWIPDQVGDDELEASKMTEKKELKLNITFKKLFKLGLYCFLGGVLFLILLFFYFSRGLPDYSTLENYHPPAVTRIYSSDGKLVEEYAKEYRIFVPITTIPKSLQEAFIAAEDRNFREHSGIDFLGIIRAAFSNVGRIAKGKRMEGGSTITQQVVKNFFLTSEQSISRKVKEAILAYRISNAYTKDQILELYLNQIYLGKGAYGVAAASIAYFNKSIDELTLAESAMLAALPKAPSTFNPEKRYEKVLARRNYVINRMVDDGYVTREIADLAINTPIILQKRDKSETISAGYYADTVREKIIELFGKEMFYTGGLTIITSMDSKYQLQANKSVRFGIREHDKRGGYRGPITNISTENWREALAAIPNPRSLLEYELAIVLDVRGAKADIGLKDGSKAILSADHSRWAKKGLQSWDEILQVGDVIVIGDLGRKRYRLRQIPEVDGAFIALEPNSGRVLAMVGGYDYKSSKFNRATQALRQPGSSIKPMIYLTAFENNYAPNSLYEDEPISIELGYGQPNYEPRNHERDFLGTMTLRYGFEKSRNIITVKLAHELGLDKVAEVIRRFGINSDPPKFYSMALGALETTVDRMASAYTTIANGGYKVVPQYIELIKDAKGNILYKRQAPSCNCEIEEGNLDIPEETPIDRIRLSDPESMYQMISFMEGAAERGTSRRTKPIGKTVACKTGTTNNSMDTWMIGMTPRISTVTYVGHDTPKSLGKTSGAIVALPIFVDFMQKAYDVPSLPFKKPDSIEEIKIDPATGKKSRDSGSIPEYFKPGQYNYNPSNNYDDEDKPEFMDDSGIY